MGFISQIILLGVLGLLANYFGVVKGKRAKDKSWVPIYSFRSVFWITLIGVLIYCGAFNWLFDYVNEQVTNPLFHFADGQDFMWNGFIVFNVMEIPVAPCLHWYAVFLFFSYCPGFMFWKLVSRAIWGERTFEKGFIYAVKPVKKHEDQY
jgi:hypothetical protein